MTSSFAEIDFRLSRSKPSEYLNKHPYYHEPPPILTLLHRKLIKKSSHFLLQAKTASQRGQMNVIITPNDDCSVVENYRTAAWTKDVTFNCDCHEVRGLPQPRSICYRRTSTRNNCWLMTKKWSPFLVRLAGLSVLSKGNILYAAKWSRRPVDDRLSSGKESPAVFTEGLAGLSPVATLALLFMSRWWNVEILPWPK